MVMKILFPFTVSLVHIEQLKDKQSHFLFARTDLLWRSGFPGSMWPKKTVLLLVCLENKAHSSDCP